MTKSPRRLGRTAEELAHLDAAVALAQPPWSGMYITAHRHYHLVKTVTGVHVRTELGGLDIEVESPNPSTAVAELNALIDAIMTVIDRGRVYMKSRGRVSLQVWHKDVGVHKNLIRIFGGNYYKHGSGLIWICSKRADLVKVYKSISPYVPEAKVERFEILPKED